MDKEDKAKILRFMEQARMKIAIVRMKDVYYFCELCEAVTGWENLPYNDVRVVECPAPFEIIG